MKKIRHSFASYFNPMTMETFIEVDELAETLAKGWGDIPKTINNTRAMELHLLGRAYISMQKRLNRLELTAAPLQGDEK